MPFRHRPATRWGLLRDRMAGCGSPNSKGNRIGRISTTGLITEFPLPTQERAQLLGITAGPDGALWFVEQDRARVGRISTNGSIT